MLEKSGEQPGSPIEHHENLHEGEIAWVEGGKSTADVFLYGDHLKSVDIRNIAASIATQIRAEIEHNPDKPPEFFVVRALEPNHVFEKFLADHKGDMQSTPWKDVDIDDLKEAIKEGLAPIREALMQELAQSIDPKTFDFIVREVNRVSGLSFTLELQHHFAKFERPDDLPELDDLRRRLLKKLWELPERSPYIAYATKMMDRDESRRQIIEKMPVAHLREIIQKEHLPLSRALEYFKNAVEGNIFLLRNGIVLMDNALTNIFVNRDTDTGALMDLDFLTDGKTSTFMPGHGAKYIPPELAAEASGYIPQDSAEAATYIPPYLTRDISKNPTYIPKTEHYTAPDPADEVTYVYVDPAASAETYVPPSPSLPRNEVVAMAKYQIGEPQVVYQLGIALQELLNEYSSDDSQHVLKTRLQDIAEHMTAPLHENRPSLAQILENITFSDEEYPPALAEAA